MSRSVRVCDGSEQQAACHRSVRGAMADEAELAYISLVGLYFTISFNFFMGVAFTVFDAGFAS